MVCRIGRVATKRGRPGELRDRSAAQQRFARRIDAARYAIVIGFGAGTA
jgi:hypothetical protein